MSDNALRSEYRHQVAERERERCVRCGKTRWQCRFMTDTCEHRFEPVPLESEASK